MARRSMMKKAFKGCKATANSAFIGARRWYGHLNPDQKFNVKVLGSAFGLAVFIGMPGFGYMASENTRLAAQEMANANAQTGAIIHEDEKQSAIKAAVANAQITAVIEETNCDAGAQVGVIVLKAEKDACGMPVAVFDARRNQAVLRGPLP